MTCQLCGLIRICQFCNHQPNDDDLKFNCCSGCHINLTFLGGVGGKRGLPNRQKNEIEDLAQAKVFDVTFVVPQGNTAGGHVDHDEIRRRVRTAFKESFDEEDRGAELIGQEFTKVTELVRSCYHFDTELTSLE